MSAARRSSLPPAWWEREPSTPSALEQVIFSVERRSWVGTGGNRSNSLIGWDAVRPLRSGPNATADVPALAKNCPTAEGPVRGEQRTERTFRPSPRTCHPDLQACEQANVVAGGIEREAPLSKSRCTEPKIRLRLVMRPRRARWSRGTEAFDLRPRQRSTLLQRVDRCVRHVGEVV